MQSTLVLSKETPPKISCIFNNFQPTAYSLFIFHFVLLRCFLSSIEYQVSNQRVSLYSTKRRALLVDVFPQLLLIQKINMNVTACKSLYSTQGIYRSQCKLFHVGFTRSNCEKIHSSYFLTLVAFATLEFPTHLQYARAIKLVSLHTLDNLGTITRIQTTTQLFKTVVVRTKWSVPYNSF